MNGDVHGSVPEQGPVASPGARDSSALRGGLRLFALLGVTLLLTGPLLLGARWSPPVRGRVLRLWYATTRRLCGVHLRVVGRPRETGPTLYVANHVSYLDIPVLGALVQASFVSKAEVRHWPAIGALSRQAGTVFIERRRAAVAAQVVDLARRMQGVDSLVVFPEGTPSDGTDVLPFKSALFGAVLSGTARSAAVVVQPVSLRYHARRDGTPLDASARERYAWFGETGDAGFAGHAWRMLCGPGVQVEAVFHEPLHGADIDDRKALARACHERIASAVRGG